MKKHKRHIIIGLLIIIGAYCIVFTVIEPISPMITDTGIVISKGGLISGEIISTQFILNVKFNKSGFQSINTDQQTYYKHNVGDKITYDIKGETNLIHTITWSFGLFFIVLLSCAGVIFISFAAMRGLQYLFDTD